MGKVDIDLDWVGSDESKPGGDTVETGIRQDAMRQVLSKLATMPGPEEKLDQDERFRSRPRALDVMPYRRHEAILVSARRGDGKTTFLTDILRLIQDGASAYGPKIKPDDKIAALYSIGIVDPTLIETKQNIVVIVIEKIKVSVDQAYRRNESAKRGAYENFKEALRELAAGLTLLDGIGDSALYGKDWADADYVLDRGLDKARSAGGFERAFHHYVREACTFIGVDAFVLAIDDVDTSFDKGWPVLEALRKYFATPHLKVILAGDLRLYNLLVRQQQWKQITKDFLDVEQKIFDIERKMGGAGSYADQLVRMVDVLQDQYLVKIVRPENRVELPPLLHFADRPGIVFRASQSDPGLEIDEERLTARYCQRVLGIRASRDYVLIRATLLRLPLRSGLQVIAGAWDLLRDRTLPSRAERKRAIDALGRVASAGLMSFDLDEYELDDPNADRVLGTLSRWMTTKEIWSSMSTFHPGGLDETRDLVSIRIAARLVELFRRNPHAALDYLLQICTIQDKIGRREVEVSEAATDNNKLTADRSLRALLSHVSSGNSLRATQFVSRLAAWDASLGRQINRGIRLSGAVVPAATRLREADAAAFDLYGLRGDFKSAFRGMVEHGSEEQIKLLIEILPPPLQGYHRSLIDAQWSYSSKRGLEAGFIATFANTIASLNNNIRDVDARRVAMIPAMQLVSGQGAENGVYSVLRLIAALSELLSVPLLPEESHIETIDELLTTISQLRSYPTSGSNGDGDSEKEPDIKDTEFFEDSEEFEEAANFDQAAGAEQLRLAVALSAWLNGINLGQRPIIVAPVTLSRIWTRFSYAFDDILRGLSHTNTRYLGVLMHRSITAFLHAVGIEELIAAGYPPKAKEIDNPIQSSFPLLQLLNSLGELPDRDFERHFRLFRAIFSCPVWGYFFARSEAEITGKDDRSQATSEIFRRYLTAVNEICGVELNYRVKFERYGRVAEFDGLYHLLNSVQLQGFGNIKREAAGRGVKLKRVLESFDKIGTNEILQSELGGTIEDDLNEAAISERRKKRPRGSGKSEVGS
ncbi:hypothetical protein [Methylobacterium fujisawaense]|uniref:hypothetical protein n=1 Tax=Methylobacterium fujisawaense TaxID=107400 RepID=UPI0036FD6BC9